jgi:tetratricopeptide (TPR) repeat protein
VVAGLITWRVITNNQDTAWANAKDYFSRADYDNAKKQIGNMAIPDDSERLRIYAQTMLATRDLDKALTAYQKLYEQNKDVSVKLFIGNIYNEQKKYDEAIKIYKDMIAVNPSNVQAYVNVATTYKLQSNRSGSIDAAKEGVKNNPTNVTLHELLVSMLMDDKTSQDYINALSDLKELSPQDPLVKALEL